MLVKKSLCIAMVAISLGRNPKCKESDISKRSGSSWYYFGNNLMYDDMLYSTFLQNAMITFPSLHGGSC
jgi:hypothetical protein